MRKTFLVVLVLAQILTLSCDLKAHQKLNMSSLSILPFSTDSITIDGNLNTFKADIATSVVEKGLELVTISITSKTKEQPPEFTVKWKIPSVDICKYWNPRLSVDRVNYYYNSLTSSSTRYAPVMSFLDQQDHNRFTFAASDGLNRLKLESQLIEEDACFHCEIHFFDEKYPKVNSYSIELLIDRRAKPFYSTLFDVSSWWSQQENYTPSITPDAAKKPMYSTWYSYHQNLDTEELLQECRESKKMGLEAIIIDDGWQTMDNKRGYAYTGDWQPDRMPEIKQFVDEVHTIGMDVILWYSVPFIGQHANNYQRFQGKYLYEWKSQGCSVLDPRYPDVRDFIISTYEEAMIDWSLDGFKLDFIGFFKTSKETDLTAGSGRDYASVNDAVDRLMSDVMKRLTALNPEVMIEFRQPYVGPLMLKYGNMLRAADCPNMETVNKVRVTDIRLLGGDAAVHSDMLMWHYDDPVESAAFQLLNVMFSVPQVSVKLNTLPQEHREMLAFWIKYWNKNRETILLQGFYPQAPDALYPIISAGNDEKMISALYQDQYIINQNLPPKYDIINAKKSSKVIMYNEASFGKYDYVIYDCKGGVVEENQVNMKLGPCVFQVPASGLLVLKKKGSN